VKVTDPLQQVGVTVAENVFVTALKQMADKLVFVVEVKPIALLQALHRFGAGRLANLQQQ